MRTAKTDQTGLHWAHRSFCYATNFEEAEGAYWFGPVHPSVCPCVAHACGHKALEIGS